MIEAPLHKKVPNNTKMYKGLLRLVFHCAFMEDDLKIFEAYGPNTVIKDCILTTDVKDCIHTCVHFLLFLACHLQLTFCFDFIHFIFRYKRLSFQEILRVPRPRTLETKQCHVFWRFCTLAKSQIYDSLFPRGNGHLR